MLKADHRTIMHQARRAVLRHVTAVDKQKQPLTGDVKRHNATAELIEWLEAQTDWPPEVVADARAAFWQPLAMACVQLAYDVLAAAGVDFAKVSGEVEETD